MQNHFSMGAINKATNTYEYPKIANKINKYKCPSCEKDVIFRNGKIKKPHFSHYKSDNPCSYYEKPNETQIHKDAKLLMKTLIDNKYLLRIYRKCYYCNKEHKYFLSINYEENKNNTSAVIEYKFNYNNSNRSADVALLENSKLKYIFEICYKNKTKEENRPEPWFEFKAETFINEINSGKNIIECIRDYKCDHCKYKEEYEIKKMKLKEEYERFKQIKEREKQEEYERKKQMKEKEEKLEKNELLLMSNEDYRLKELQIKLKIERELNRKKEEEERELKHKEEEEYEKEKIRNELKFWKHSHSNNDKCSGCNINNCKCLTSHFIKDEYNILKCLKCNKRKCKCIKITNFLKK